MTTALLSALRGATAAMGTRFELVVASDDDYRVRPLIEAALREIEDLHARLTRFSNDSLVAHINRTAAHTAVRLDADTFALLAEAALVREQSGGAFDVALGSGQLLLDPATRSVAFDRPGVTLDLGGIAKGFALDRAADILRDGSVTAALLHGGTSTVLAIGSPPDAPAWRVALAHGRALPYVELADQALSVSRPFSHLVHGDAHIVDPRSGAPGQRCFAVVIGPSACAADAWSTALAVIGKRPEGMPAEWTTSIEFEYE